MKYTVRFQPIDISITVPEGTTISDAARMAEVTTLHLPCGGRGTCGKCTVEISKQADPPRLVPACTTKITTDLTITLPPPVGHSSGSIVEDTSVDHIDPQSSLFSPICRVINVTVPPPAAGVNYSDLQRLSQALGGKDDIERLTCPRKILKRIAETLRREDGMVNTVVTDTWPSQELCSIVPGSQPPQVYGIAADIGTTTVALRLVNLVTGEIVASASDYNAQIARGGDIISRIDYARTPERLEELNDLIVNTVNDQISSLLVAANVVEDNIHAMVIAGNSTMMHLFLGLRPDYIREAPYVPTVNEIPQLRAADCSLLINPDAIIMFAPGVGSYVGGDITAGLLCTDMITSTDTLTLFIDIGTNGEIVIGNREFLLTCACSAGPAFEGSGIGCGMRAVRGAVDSITIDPADGSIDYTVIGDALPRGICGSGLISLLGELLKAGIIDRSGKLTDKFSADHHVTIEGTKGFQLIDASLTHNNKPLIITEADIDNLLRTKAALYAAGDLLLKNAGLDFSDIGKVLIAGGFGKYIDIEAAVRIGLLPDIDRSRFFYLGNTSLAGATRLLLSRESRDSIADLPDRMTYIDLSSESGYMDAYTAALFLPHTELERFPSAG
ncbi:MAG: DUF4445 domain-containing protein [Chitinispirillaceae bacterium]|nr:DUF4445 domain-containing protein [Chitinispirillaceae bacterium]